MMIDITSRNANGTCLSLWPEQLWRCLPVYLKPCAAVNVRWRTVVDLQAQRCHAARAVQVCAAIGFTIYTPAGNRTMARRVVINFQDIMGIFVMASLCSTTPGGRLAGLFHSKELDRPIQPWP